MMTNSNAMDLIRNRNSCRSFDGEPLSQDAVAALEQAFQGCLENPFGAAVRLPILDGGKLAGKKLGTYGVIRGASTYFAGVVKKHPLDIESLGWSMERAVLAAAALGLGTCWLAGTYSRADFASAVPMDGDERIVCVSPVGRPAPKRTVLDTMMRGVAGSAKRKPWHELFFDGSAGKPLGEREAGEWKDALEAVRLAPSGSNGQPWRAVRREGAFHFYRAVKEGSEYGRVDMGIAACHFELVARERGLPGRWKADEPAAAVPGWQYSMSWVIA